MSFNKYPKNYHSNGYGWHNLAAMGYAKPPPNANMGSMSSGVSSINPSQYSYPKYPSVLPPLPGQQPAFSGMPQMPSLPGSNQNLGIQLSYGFAPNIAPCSVPNVHREDSIDSGPTIGWSIGGGSSTNSIHSNVSETVHDPIKAAIETPVQAVHVPPEEMPIYSWGKWVNFIIIILSETELIKRNLIFIGKCYYYY